MNPVFRYVLASTSDRNREMFVTVLLFQCTRMRLHRPVAHGRDWDGVNLEETA
jgi:hypothetical protein